MLGPITDDNDFSETLGLRTNMAYPFTGVWLIIEQHTRPSGLTRCDTVGLDIIDSDGRPMGKGISHFQHDLPLNDITLQAGDSLFVSIRHDMKREVLPGISDVGLTLTRRQH